MKTQSWSISGDYVKQINLCIYIRPRSIIVKSYRKCVCDGLPIENEISIKSPSYSVTSSLCGRGDFVNLKQKEEKKNEISDISVQPKTKVGGLRRSILLCRTVDNVLEDHCYCKYRVYIALCCCPIRN